ncbi:MAG: hypothetical protein U0324_32280 [Polyangiales bacterium]
MSSPGGPTTVAVCGPGMSGFGVTSASARAFVASRQRKALR